MLDAQVTGVAFGSPVEGRAVPAHVEMTQATLLFRVDEEDEATAAPQTEVLVEVLLLQ